jgi:hypothetical protein
MCKRTVVIALSCLFVGALAYSNSNNPCPCAIGTSTDAHYPCLQACTTNTPTGATGCTFHTSSGPFECDTDYEANQTKCATDGTMWGSQNTYTGTCGSSGTSQSCQSPGPPVLTNNYFTKYKTIGCIGS